MNVYCIVMFEFNYSVGDIRNSDLVEGIICSGEGSWGKGGGKWGKGGREVGKRGREVGVRGEGSGECLPPCPTLTNRDLDHRCLSANQDMVQYNGNAKFFSGGTHYMRI